MQALKQKSTRRLLIILGVVLVGGLGYVFLAGSSGSTPESALSFGQGGDPADFIGSTPFEFTVQDEFLALLTSIELIELDSEIFTDPAYLELNDISIPLVPIRVKEGRDNPFAPIEGYEGDETSEAPQGDTIFGDALDGTSVEPPSVEENAPTPVG